MKRLMVTWLLAMTALVGWTGQAAAQAKTLKMTTIAISNSPWHKALLKFKEIVDTESKGRYVVNVYTDGQLGDIAQLLSAMQIGTVEFGYFGLSSISFVRGGEALNVIYVPYLFKDADATSANDSRESTRASSLPPLRDTVDVGRGAPDKTATQVKVRRSQMQDPAWKLDERNQKMLTDAQSRGALTIIED